MCIRDRQNVAYMVGLAFAIAASVNFPILFFSMYWSKLTTKGAFFGGAAGLITAILCVLFGPIVWVDILGNANAIFPYKYPALFSMSIAFIAIIIVSYLDKSEQAKKEIKAFDNQFVRAQTGIGADGPVEH